MWTNLRTVCARRSCSCPCPFLCPCLLPRPCTSAHVFIFYCLTGLLGPCILWVGAGPRQRRCDCCNHHNANPPPPHRAHHRLCGGIYHNEHSEFCETEGRTGTNGRASLCLSAVRMWVRVCRRMMLQVEWIIVGGRVRLGLEFGLRLREYRGMMLGAAKAVSRWVKRREVVVQTGLSGHLRRKLGR